MHEIEEYESDLIQLHSLFLTDRTKYEISFVQKLLDYTCELERRNAFANIRHDVNVQEFFGSLYIKFTTISQKNTQVKTFYNLIFNTCKRYYNQESPKTKEIIGVQLATSDDDSIGEDENARKDPLFKFFMRDTATETAEKKLIYVMAVYLFLYGYVFPPANIPSKAKKKEQMERFGIKYGKSNVSIFENLRTSYKSKSKSGRKFTVTNPVMWSIVYFCWRFSYVFFELDPNVDEVEFILEGAGIYFSYDAKKVSPSSESRTEQVERYFRNIVETFKHHAKKTGKQVIVDDLYMLRNQMMDKIRLFELFKKDPKKLDDAEFMWDYHFSKVSSQSFVEIQDEYRNEINFYYADSNGMDPKFNIRYKGKVAIPKLLTLLNGDHDDIVKLRAIRAIGKLGRDGAPLIPLLEKYQENWRFNGTLPIVIIQQAVDVALKKLRACVFE